MAIISFKLNKQEEKLFLKLFFPNREKVIAYELELLDHAERLLSDEPIPTHTEMAYMALDVILYLCLFVLRTN